MYVYKEPASLLRVCVLIFLSLSLAGWAVRALVLLYISLELSLSSRHFFSLAKLRERERERDARGSFLKVP